MTYDEPAVPETVHELLDGAPDFDPAVDGALDNLDQFHLGGAEAVDLLIATLTLAPGDTVLDVGSGFGGPARQIARRTGATVVGVDLAAGYVQAARDLTARAGLSDQVGFEVTDIATFHPRTPFSAAVTMHVQMSVAEKSGWFSQIGRRLAPGARLAVWEVCQQPGADITWPMPWSLDGTDSFLVPEASLLDAIRSAGFEAETWADRSSWARDWGARTFADGLPPGPALPMLLDDGYTRVLNFMAAVDDGAVQVWQGSFVKEG
jgi:SAM-dependent methyltransferase